LKNEDSMHRFTILLVAAGVAASGAPAVAQTATPQASGPSEYRSAFDAYRPFKDQAVASWRDVNLEVARVGGHAGSLKPSNDATAGPAAQRPANPGAPVDRAPTHPGHR